ncbi:hypothetical protein RQP46_007523 [Phenoliferia psychrophenolica]
MSGSQTLPRLFSKALDPGHTTLYFLPKPGGGDSDTRATVKFGTCKFEVKVADGGEDPRLRVTRIAIEVHFKEPDIAWLHLAVPKDLHYSVLTANLSYERATTTTITKGIIINDSQSDESVVWTAKDTTKKGINLNIPVAVIVRHPPSQGFQADFIVRVHAKVRRGPAVWTAHSHTEVFNISTDGVRDVGTLDEIIMAKFKTHLGREDALQDT